MAAASVPSKADVRGAVRRQLATLSLTERALASARIRDQLDSIKALSGLLTARFIPLATEPDIGAPGGAPVPQVVTGSRILQFGVPLESIDAFLVPALGVDRIGTRLGRGGGHYDATLTGARSDALRVGIVFDCQFVPSLPTDVWDEPLDCVITEQRVIWFERRDARCRSTP